MEQKVQQSNSVQGSAPGVTPLGTGNQQTINPNNTKVATNMHINEKCTPNQSQSINELYDQIVTKGQDQHNNSTGGGSVVTTHSGLPPAHPQQNSTSINYNRNTSPRTLNNKNKNSYLSNSSSASSNGKKHNQSLGFANTFSKNTQSNLIKDGGSGSHPVSKTGTYNNNYANTQSILSPLTKGSNNLLQSAVEQNIIPGKKNQQQQQQQQSTKLLPTKDQLVSKAKDKKVVSTSQSVSSELQLEAAQLMTLFKDQLEQIFVKYEEDQIYCDKVDDDMLIMSTTCDLQNQRVIKADADRTRGGNGGGQQDIINKEYLELILTLYSKRGNIRYKQGLNEVLAPFLFMQDAAGEEVKVAYNCFSIFVWRFLSTFYLDDDFFSLQSALALLQLLFRYHEPELAIHIDKNQISPEMYATPWFLTFFANKLEMNVLLAFWKLLIQEDEQSFIFFFSIAMLSHNKQAIKECDGSNLPTVMTRLTITTTEELNIIWKKAKSLRDGTPHSFQELPDQKLIFNFEFQKESKEKLLSNLEKIENFPCLPILPEELFFYSYPELVSCANPSCLNSFNGYKQAAAIQQQQQTQMLNTQNTMNSFGGGGGGGGGGRRNSASYDGFEILSPSKEYEKSQKVSDEYQQYQQHVKRVANNGSDSGSLLVPMAGGQEGSGGSKKANIHAIIKKDIQSPFKQKEDQLAANMRGGIDLSSQRSPFKQMNKQSPAQADAMPLETDSNVNDDAAEQQESHIDLINETA